MAKRKGKAARQTEIGDLHRTVAVDEDVLRLDVAVDDAVEVQVSQP